MSAIGTIGLGCRVQGLKFDTSGIGVRVLRVLPVVRLWDQSIEIVGVGG